MKYNYNRELAKRFVSDYKLPMPIINAEIFEHHLNLYEDDYGAMSKWNDLNHFIDIKFDGNIEAFLKEYYDIRENIIQTVINSQAYKAFNSMDMSVFAIKNKSNITSNNIYNESNVGETFLSIDLKKANFQTLKHIDNNIVLGADTYEDFIGKFTDWDYVKTSKYTRQVIFGMMNPKRHITAEKYFIHKIYEFVVSYYPCLNGKCVSMSTDEIIFKLDENWDVDFDLIEAWTSKNFCGFEVNVEIFKLKGYNLNFKKSGSTRTTFYVKEHLDIDQEHKFRLISAPLPYHCIIYKLYKGLEMEELDYHFDYEGIDAKFCEDFIIEEVAKK